MSSETPATETPAQAVEEIVIPDVIERLPKPDKAAHDAQISVLDSAIKKLQARTTVIRAEMDALKNNRGTYGEQIQASKAKYAVLRSEKENLIQQRNQITARLRQTRDAKDSAVKQQRSVRSTLKFGSEEEFDKAIADLKYQQETRSMPLVEEKRVIKEIEQLQSQKLQVGKFSDDQGVVDKQNENIKETRSLQVKKNEEIDAVQEKMTAQKAELDELYRLNEEENKKDQFPVLAKERNEIKKQLDDKFTALKQLRKEFKEANNKYFDNIRLVRKKKELERQKEDEARKTEYEAKLADYEKEMAKIHPYQDEMDLCDALVQFLEKTYAKELKEKEDKAAETAAAPIELDGLKPLQRKEEDFMMLGAGKKGKKGRQGKKAKKDAKLVLPLAQVEAFGEQTSRPKAEKPTEAVETATPTKASSPKKKSNKNKKFNAGDNDAFPSLGGVAAELPSWGPGMAAPVFDDVPAVAAEFANADVVTEDE
ncbi:hypothetical protein BBO99_00001607 [Phytophthora kernoviae]|uniref:Uncharacterized protein n=2 Tax=Phytophthora kernoviae TaxID=325452 RepID=A0A3F2RMI3_9STRA|nr:hypothetical protein G195_002247 [Phytophthora kernoviae 00238/432]KAG2531256.1 hypothetical protein JM16_001210 [Phytophthora kernoviae]KAG2531903.1 hypothetical protein JM18_001525 [Phytophthora kernoviae]RLN45454.1 hypothetical protein BBJ29_005188 [Phytophthora kernoviae]RLN45691.1 hypothetical protein BBI17_001377 [Phytophthora kernoviae]